MRRRWGESIVSTFFSIQEQKATIIADKDDQLKAKHREIEARDEQLKDKDRKMAAKDRLISAKDSEISEKDRGLISLQQRCGSLQTAGDSAEEEPIFGGQKKK